ncbi:MAG: FAD-dependent oxidoreductase [Clostridia bacterium]|nr:FAD-dependent oxidoreductase [Clostridia bacterium]
MKHYDLIVVGGGLSGVAAAAAGARDGLKTLLIEKNGSLGGAMTNNLVYPFMKFMTPVNGEIKILCAGLFTEMREREQKYDTSGTIMKFRPEYFKLVLDDMLCDYGVDVLFHAQVYALETKERALKSVRVVTNAGEMEFSADYFVDATGDGNLFTMAGCAYQLGRESDGLCQPMTTCFRMCGVDIDLFKEEKPQLQELYKAARERGEIKNPRENILTFSGIGEGVLHLNTTRVVKVDPTDAFGVSRAEIEARRQVHEIVDFLKKNSRAFEHATLISIAAEIGVRESRKLCGEYVLTAEDLLAQTMFEDAVVLANYNIDIHNPAGTGTDIHYFQDGEYYSIPYRSLLPREYDNLLVAGRCISATHEAQAAVRVMPICACMGEAAGVAIALAKKTGTNTHTVDVAKLRSILRKYGATLD